MKSILIGNGINVEFGGKDYCNSKIIERVLYNLRTKDYSNIFGNKVSNHEVSTIFYGVFGELKNVLKGKYDKCCTTLDEKFILQRIKQQYSFESNITDIGMEDYFFLLLVQHKYFHDSDIIIKGLFDGFCYLFLDAIYNYGEIQKINEHITSIKRQQLYKIFKEFDNIFTVNYDCNIEKISGKNVHYLHGDFNTLCDQYDSNTLIGMFYQRRQEDNPVTSQNKHIYSNAIMGFNGFFKEKIMDCFENANFGISEIMKRYKLGLSEEDNDKIELLRKSNDKREKFVYSLIKIKKQFPNLSFHEYPSNLFKSIIGELHIVGLSPNNDEHIWKIIENNNNLSKIIYYYKYKKDEDMIRTLYSSIGIMTCPVEKFW